MEELRQVAIEAIERCQRKRVRDWSAITGLATVVMFGLAFSTFITLLFVPVMYSLFDGLAARLGRRKNTSGGGLRKVEEK